MNSENSKISDPHRLLLNLADKVDWGRKNKYIDFTSFSIYYTRKNIKKSCNEEIQLPDGSYSISDIQDYGEYILKKHGEKQLILQ